MKTVIKKSILLLAVFALFGFGGNVYAQNEIILKDALGNELDNGSIFNEDNIYPGWSKSEAIIVQNKGAENAMLYITFNIGEGEKLAERLKLYVIKSNGDIAVDGVILADPAVNGQALYIDDLDADTEKEYEIKIEFDISAGNEYQSLTTNFDVDFAIEGDGDAEEEVVPTDTESADAESYGETGEGEEETKDDNDSKKKKSETIVNITAPVSYYGATSDPETGDIQEEKVEEKTNQGENQDYNIGIIGDTDTSGGQVAGASACRSWPFWVWLVVMFSYAGITYIIGRRARDVSESKRNLLWQGLVLLGAIGLWYFFDTCRTYTWVPIIASVVGVVLVLVLFNRTSSNTPPTQTPPNTTSGGPRVT